jgi:hypothetical protein
MKKEGLINYSIGRFNFRNITFSFLLTNVGDPLPIIKRLERTDLEMLSSSGVVDSGLKQGDFVVIGRAKKLV